MKSKKTPTPAPVADGRQLEGLQQVLERAHEHDEDRQHGPDEVDREKHRRRAPRRRCAGASGTGRCRWRPRAQASLRPACRLAGFWKTFTRSMPQDNGHDQQGQRDGGPAAELEVLEGDVEQVDRQDVGGVGRPAAGQDQDGVDEAEIVHEAQQDRDQQERIEVGQGDRDEVAQFAGAVDHVGLELVARHALEAGQGDQRDQRRPLPDVDQHDAPHGGVGASPGSRSRPGCRHSATASGTSRRSSCRDSTRPVPAITGAIIIGIRKMVTRIFS